MNTFKEELAFSTSMNSSFESSQMSVLNFIGYALQLTSTGSPVGTVKIQISCDEMGLIESSSSWNDLDDSSVAISASGVITYDVADAFYTKIRVVYTRTSGTGTMTAKITRKR